LPWEFYHLNPFIPSSVVLLGPSPHRTAKPFMPSQARWPFPDVTTPDPDIAKPSAQFFLSSRTYLVRDTEHAANLLFLATVDHKFGVASPFTRHIEVPEARRAQLSRGPTNHRSPDKQVFLFFHAKAQRSSCASLLSASIPFMLLVVLILSSAVSVFYFSPPCLKYIRIIHSLPPCLDFHLTPSFVFIFSNWILFPFSRIITPF